MKDNTKTPVSPDTLPEGLNDDTRQKLASIMRDERDKTAIHQRDSHKITILVCELIKDMYEQGVPVKEITDYVPANSPNTVYYHINDNCSHEHRMKLTYSECGWMRVKAHNGDSSKELAKEYGVVQEVATRHVLGKCNHEDGILPVIPEKLRANAYTGPAMQTSVCPVCKHEFEHTEYTDRTTCSSVCNAKYASKAAHKHANKSK